MPPEETGTERAQRLVTEGTARLIEQLKAGRSEALKEYLAAMGRFHRYSWTNTMLIHSQKPDATRVAGYHTWRDLGRAVRRSEKGIVIFAPIVGRPKEGQTPPPDERARNANRSEPRGFRASYVFDVSQTEGKAIPEPVRTSGNPGEYLARLRDAVWRRGVQVEYHDSLVEMFGAEGLSKGGRIDLARGLEPAEEFSVLAHEFAHELLHHGPDRREFSKTVRETQAEAVAYVISQGVGLDTRTAASDYISLYNGDATTLRESLEAVQRTSSEILRELLPDGRDLARGLATESSREPAAERSEQLDFPDRAPKPQSAPEPPLSIDR